MKVDLLMGTADKRLQMAAALQAFKLGHKPGTWIREVLTYGSRPETRTMVETYTTACTHCKSPLGASSGLEEQMWGAALDEPCMANTGYEDRVIPFHDDTGCSQILRFDRDRETVTLRECA